MGERVDILTPVGRLVMGSFYKPQTQDMLGKPLVFNSGANIGKPRVDYFFAVAIAKGTEPHWSKTEWGAKIYAVGCKGFPAGQFNAPTFAWKVVDGDSQVPNSQNKKPCDRIGYPGNWVLTFSGSIAPTIWDKTGKKQIIENDYVNLGDYIQVFGYINDNATIAHPGIYLNHKYVSFIGYGERIVYGPAADSVGFGNSPTPPGVSAVPLSSGFNPVAPHQQPVAPQPQQPVAPSYPQILTPPSVSAVPKRIMTPLANGATYEQFVAAGFTDLQMIQQGYMLA